MIKSSFNILDWKIGQAVLTTHRFINAKKNFLIKIATND